MSPAVRNDHQRMLLGALRNHGPRSAGELTEAVGVSRSKVGQEITRLLADGVVEHVGYDKSRGGRRSELVDFAGGLRFVGVDVGTTIVEVAAVDGRLTVLERLTASVQIEAGPDHVLDLVAELVGKLRSQGVLGVPDALGVGVPGPVSFGEGLAVAPPLMPSWHRSPIREILARRLGCVVAVDNDVNLLALAEMQAGVGRATQDFLFVKIGTGIGCGICAGGRLHRGASGSAGDIGHIVYGESGPVCACGRSGCLEAWFSEPALLRDAVAAARRGQSDRLAASLELRGHLELADVLGAVADSDPAALELVHAGGRRVGGVLAGLVNFFNPSLIVLGGALAVLGHPLLAEIRSEVFRRSTPLASSGLPVVLSELGELGGVVGAAALARDRLFETDRLPTVSPAR